MGSQACKWISAVVLITLVSCGSNYVTPPGLHKNVIVPGYSGSSEFANPSNALELVDSRVTSAWVLDRTGSEIVPLMHHRFVPEDTSGRFVPDWDGIAPELSDAAWATYCFNLEEYNGETTFALTWSAPPADYNDLSLGFSNWAGDCWEWHPVPETWELELGESGYTDYIHPESGEMFVVVMLLGTDQAVLDLLRAGEAYGDPITILGITPDPAFGTIGDDLSFSVQFSGIDDEDTTFNWDFDGGAELETSSERNPLVSIIEPGHYNCLVTVNNYYGPPDELGFLLVVNPVIPDRWTTFGHDVLRTRRSPYVAAQTNNLKWSLDLGGRIESSPAIGEDGTIYVGAQTSLYAINPNGTEQWSYLTGGQVDSSPTVAPDGTIYVGSDDAYLYALNPDGTLKWEYKTYGDVYSSPAIGADGTVYFSNCGYFSYGVYAVDAEGEEKWSHPSPSEIFTSPAVSPDGTMYIGIGGTEVSVLWSFTPTGLLKWGAGGSHGSANGPAVCGNGHVLLSGGDGRLTAFNTNGIERWMFAAGGADYSAPAIGLDGKMYVGSSNGYLHAANADGTYLWSFATGGLVSDPIIGGDGTLYIGSGDDYFYAVNPDGTEKWSYETGDHVWASGAIAEDGTVYIGGYDGVFYAFGPDPGD